MASKEQLKENRLKQLENWHLRCPAHLLSRAYNTGYGGQGTKSEETVTKADFDAVAIEFKDYIKKNIPGYGGRDAKSFSGTAHNEWSYLAEPFGDASKKKFNYHIRISG